MNLNRRSVRLPSYDYAQQGAYFVTVCTEGRRCVLGEVVDDEFRANLWGEAVAEAWLLTPQVRPGVGLDVYAVMPNHFHAIVFLGPDQPGSTAPEASDLARPPRSLGALISGFKGAATRRARELSGRTDLALWQRGFCEHVIRDEESLGALREYILGNPKQWALDAENPFRPT